MGNDYSLQPRVVMAPLSLLRNIVSVTNNVIRINWWQKKVLARRIHSQANNDRLCRTNYEPRGDRRFRTTNLKKREKKWNKYRLRKNLTWKSPSATNALAVRSSPNGPVRSNRTADRDPGENTLHHRPPQSRAKFFASVRFVFSPNDTRAYGCGSKFHDVVKSSAEFLGSLMLDRDFERFSKKYERSARIEHRLFLSRGWTSWEM